MSDPLNPIADLATAQEEVPGSMDEARRSFDRLDEAAVKAILQNLLDDSNQHDISIAHDAAVKDED